MSATVDLEGFLIGDDLEYVVGPGPIEGLLGNPPVRTNDTERGHADGAVFGQDLYGVRIISIPVIIHGSDPADCLALVSALEAAWSATGDLSNSTLTVTTWGVTRTFTGRPRTCAVSATDLESGVATALLEFHVSAEVAGSS